MTESNVDVRVMDCLTKIFNAEMAGIHRYMHYSFMIMGHQRIPIQGWLRSQATESMAHATTIGEKITAYGGHPPMGEAKVDETNMHNIDALLKESLAFEENGVALYKHLAELAEEVGDIALEELAREMVKTETEHVEEVRKMLRKEY